MSFKSSSRVTGLSLQTNRTFSGGLTSASGRSPIYNPKPRREWFMAATPKERARCTDHLQDLGAALGFSLLHDGIDFVFIHAFELVNLLIVADATSLYMQS